MKKIKIIIAVLLIGFVAKAQVKVPAPLVRNALTDTTYGTHYDTLQYGGYMVFKSITGRDAIPYTMRKVGMLAAVDTVVYQLKGGIANINWSLFKPGGGGSTYTANSPVIITGNVISVDTSKSSGRLATYSDNEKNTLQKITERGNTTTLPITIQGTVIDNNGDASSVHIGNVGNGVSNSYVNAIGLSAAYDNTGNYVNAMGLSAAYGNTGNYVNAIGYKAASDNSGSYVNAIGGNAADANIYDNIIVIGTNAQATASNQFVFKPSTYAQRNSLQNYTADQLITWQDASGTVAFLSDIISSSGTVTSFSKTDGFGIISSVANSTTTPNHSVRIDSLNIVTITRLKDTAIAIRSSIVTPVNIYNSNGKLTGQRRLNGDGYGLLLDSAKFRVIDTTTTTSNLFDTNQGLFAQNSDAVGVTTFQNTALNGWAIQVNDKNNLDTLNKLALDFQGIKLTAKTFYPSTITATGTTATQTINKNTGQVNAAAAATSVQVNNSLVTTSSIVNVNLIGNDATAIIRTIVKTNGSFTIFFNTPPTNEVALNFWVTN